MNYTLGVDVSYYQQKVDWPALKAAGVEFAFIKATSGLGKDSMFPDHAAGADKAGLIVGCYHWCDPIMDDARQAANVLETIKDYPVSMIALDVEQWWGDWGLWYQSIQGKISGASVPKLSPQRISDNGHNVARYIEAKDPLKRPIIIYTAKWFMDSYSPQIAQWVTKYKLWAAQYPYAAGAVKVAWNEFKAKFLPQTKPILPKGLTEWSFWQFTGDKFQLPGVYGDKGGLRTSAVDVNWFNGDLAALYDLVGKTDEPPIPVELTDTEKLRLLWKAQPELWS
jgi:GH25 family lysozyme M1 (1,4-beta-N-acetylmuramidase)